MSERLSMINSEITDKIMQGLQVSLEAIGKDEDEIKKLMWHFRSMMINVNRNVYILPSGDYKFTLVIASVANQQIRLLVASALNQSSLNFSTVSAV